MTTQQEIRTINGVLTHVYQLGDPMRCVRSAVIIPGNPGLGGFYIPFAHELFNLFNENVAVVIVSQAGHSPPLEHCFTLKEQIEHKLHAIEQLLPHRDDHRLILIGHSIGAHMVVQMLDKLDARVERAFLLFPTIERMRESEAGQRFVRLYRVLLYLLPFLCWIVHILLPFEWLKRKLVSSYFTKAPAPDRRILVDTVLYDLLNPSTVRNILQMANEEMAVVRDRPDRLIERFLPRLTFYYGTNDHWVPRGVSAQVKERYPKGDIIECTNNYIHAFVLRHSKELAKIVFDRANKR